MAQGTKPHCPKCCARVSPANSARPFRNPAPIFGTSKVRAILANIEKAYILEIGAGCLRNSLFLGSLGHRVFVLEVQGVEERFRQQYKVFRQIGGSVIGNLPHTHFFDIAVATFVIETICDPTKRRELILGVRKSLRPKGFLIMSVRGPSDLRTADGS